MTIEERLERALAEIRTLTKPNLTTETPTIFHPAHLSHPELGPIIQKHLENGTALLSQPLCLECSEKDAEIERLKAEIEKWKEEA